MDVHESILLFFFVYEWRWGDHFFLIKTLFNNLVDVILEVLSPGVWGLSWMFQLLEALPKHFFYLDHPFSALGIHSLWTHNKSACIIPWYLCENEMAKGGKNTPGNGSTWGFRCVLWFHDQFLHHVVFFQKLLLCFANILTPWNLLLLGIFLLVGLKFCSVSENFDNTAEQTRSISINFIRIAYL